MLDAKAHLRIDETDEDSVIAGLIDAASDHLQSIGVDVSSTPLPPAIAQAILLLVGHYYENREATIDRPMHALPLGVARLIAPYRSIDL